MPPNSRKSKKKSKTKQNIKRSVGTANAASHSSQHHHHHHGILGTKIYDEDNKYPSSRLIKRAPNGDVIVESLPEKKQQRKSQHQHHQHYQHQENDIFEDIKRQQSPMAFTLDSHWESLTSEEKKTILRIEKDEVFDVIRKYQDNHGCNCSVCGRRHMAMDQEMERIYNTLYELDKDRDPEINPVKFHLSIIKELQDSKAHQQQQQQEEQWQRQRQLQEQLHQQQLHQQQLQQEVRDLQEDTTQNNNTKFDEVVKFFLSSNAVDSLKEEVMHFKQNKQKQQPQHLRQSVQQQEQEKGQQHHGHNPQPLEHDKQNHRFQDRCEQQPRLERVGLISDSNGARLPISDSAGKTSPPMIDSDVNPSVANNVVGLSSAVDPEMLQGKYLNFAKTFVSSHPKIAQEYVNRMMMYPDMRALTDDLMNNNGQGFIQAVEGFVLQQQQHHQQHQQHQHQQQQQQHHHHHHHHHHHQQQHRQQHQQCQQTNLQQYPLDDCISVDLSKYQHLGDAREFITMLHNGKPLMESEYVNLQRHIAERMTNSYDTQRKEFKEVSQLERELFIRFMFGEDRKKFGDLIMESFKEKFSDDYGTAAIGASLAAAAAATSASMKIPGNDDTDADYDYDQDENDEAIDSGEYDGRLDDYSEYDQDEDEDDDFEDEEEYGTRSEIEDEKDPELAFEYVTDRNGSLQDNHGDIERREYRHQYHSHQCGREYCDEDEENAAEEVEEEDYDSSLDESDRLEEGRKLIQIAITKLLQGRIMESYHEKQAENNRLKLLQELEIEEQKKRAKEEKKQKKREKEKEKKRQLQLAKEEEVRRKEEEAETIKREAEEREKQRREAQRKKVEEVKRRKDEERKRKLEDQRKREEDQERQKKLKEEQKRKRDEEKRKREEQKKREQDLKRLEGKKQQASRRIAEQQQETRVENEDEGQQSAEKFSMDKFQKSGNLRSESSLKAFFDNVYGGINGASRSAMSGKGNDDMSKLVNPTVASSNIRTAPMGGSVQKPLELGNGLSRQDMPSKPVVSPGTTSIFDGCNTLSAFDPLPSLSSQLGVGQDCAATALTSQSYDFNSWNGFLGANLAGSLENQGPHQQAQSFQEDLQRQQQCQHQASQQSSQRCSVPPPFGLGNPVVSKDKTFEEEMNTLTDMLASAGLGDHTVDTHNSFGQTPLWSSNTQSLVPIGRNSATPATTNAVGDAATAATGPHSFIWEASPIQDIGLRNGITPSTPSHYATSRIWANSGSCGISFLEGSSAPTADGNQRDSHRVDPVAASTNVPPPSTSPVQNSSNFITENIYGTYSAFIAAQNPSPNDHYISSTLVHQNSICRNMDYATFITYLLSMRASHGCEFLTNETGTITHVKMAIGLHQGSSTLNPLQNKTYPTASRTNTLAGNAFSQTEILPPSDSLNSDVNVPLQLYSIGQQVNSSSVSNIWS